MAAGYFVGIDASLKADTFSRFVFKQEDYPSVLEGRTYGMCGSGSAAQDPPGLLQIFHGRCRKPASLRQLVLIPTQQ